MTYYIWKYKWGYLVAVVSLLCSVTLDNLAPQVSKHIVDDVIVGGQMEMLTKLLLGFVIIGIGRGVFQYTKEYMFDVSGAKVMVEIRTDLFRHIQTLSSNYFDKTNTGELMARVKDDVDRLWDMFGFVSMLLIEVFVHSALILYFMFTLSPTLAIVPTLAMVICASVAITMERKLDGVYEEISEENAKLTVVAEENIMGVRTVKAFAKEKFEIDKFLSHNKRYYDLNMQQSKIFVKYNPILTLVTKLLPFVVLLQGGVMVINGTISLGTLSAMILYTGNVVWPMEMLGWLSNCASSAFASRKKLMKIYEVVPQITEIEEPVVLEKVHGKITFDHVSFHKEDEHEILKDISFTVESGKTIGIMGATGAGKTSIIQLLQRMYDATDGAILLDDINIKNLSLKQLRGSIEPVMQDVFLFSDTIAENVKLGKKKSITNHTIRNASRAAMAAGFIENLEESYDTVIGERGVGLSGGQKQRISIARALAKEQPILVMDDSTSALDMETEHEIHQTLKGLSQVTKIVIAHRISAVRNADEILFLENGAIAERGTHEELLAAKGLYYETYLSQYGEVLEQLNERRDA